MTKHHLYLKKDPPLAWIVFNRPDMRNAVSLAMWKILPDLIGEVDNDDTLRVLIIRGEGDDAFISGADISQFEKVCFGVIDGEYDKSTGNALKMIEQMQKPVIAMIHGYCMGGGCSIAMACDLRLASNDAKFSIPAARIGIAYSPERGARQLVHLVGQANAAEMLLSGREYDADEAYHMGLINRVIPKKELEAYTKRYALDIADNAPYSLMAHKIFIREVLNPSSDSNLNELSFQCINSQDYKEGVAAFLEKRKPKFLGK